MFISKKEAAEYMRLVTHYDGNLFILQDGGALDIWCDSGSAERHANIKYELLSDVELAEECKKGGEVKE